MENDKIEINLRLGKYLFPATILRNQEEHYRAAGKLINEKLTKYTEKHPGRTDEQYMLMTLVDIAFQLIELDASKGEETYNGTLLRIMERVNAALNKEE